MPVSSRRPHIPGHVLESLTWWHLSVFVVGITWGFGGRIHWMDTPMIVWGTLGIVLTLAGLWQRVATGRALRWPLLCLLPGIVFGILTLLSAVNPSFAIVSYFGAQVYRPIAHITWLPSSFDPALTLHGLWLYAGLVLSAFNAALNIDSRRRLMRLLILMAINAAALAVFGTIQKLLRTDIMLGWETSPNPAFFASFIYHNHWGAFALLHLVLMFGLVYPLSRHDQGRGFWHSPALLALLGALFLAATLPLSTSRSSAVLGAIVIAGTTGDAVRRFWQNATTRERRRRARTLTVSLVAALLLSGMGVAVLAAPQIEARIEQTIDQLNPRKDRSYADDRFEVYRDTWKIGRQQPITGWGFDTYRLLWLRFNTRPKSTDGPQYIYEEAHSDWLQTFAETGAVGVICVAALWLMPWFMFRQRMGRDSLAVFLAFGTVILAIYAAVEFPFENPAVTLCFWTVNSIGVRLLSLGESLSARAPFSPASG